LLEVGPADVLVGVAIPVGVMAPVVPVVARTSVAFTPIQTARWLFRANSIEKQNEIHKSAASGEALCRCGMQLWMAMKTRHIIRCSLPPVTIISGMAVWNFCIRLAGWAIQRGSSTNVRFTSPRMP
jgi:hypothetical protein